MTQQIITFDSPYSDDVVKAAVKRDGNVVELSNISENFNERGSSTVKILLADTEKIKKFLAISLDDIDNKYSPVKIIEPDNIFVEIRQKLISIFTRSEKEE